MDKQSALTPFERELKAILDGPEPAPGFVQGLHASLLRAQPKTKPGSRWIPLPWGAGQTGWGWAAAALALVVLVTFLAIGPERVLAAAQHWLGGFIPGVGFVDNESSLRILEEPVHASVESAAIAVEAAYTNADETAIRIQYQDDSRSCQNTTATYEDYRSRLNDTVYLELPDGRRLVARTPRFFRWGLFPPLPAGVNEAVLVVPPDVIHACPVGDPVYPAATSTFCQCLDEELLWRIPLHFIVPPPGSVLPVVDNVLPTAFPITTASAQPSQPTVLEQALPTVTLVPPDAAPDGGPQPELVGKLVTLDDGYLFLAALKRDPNGSISYSFGMNERHFQVVDAAGSEIPVEEVDRSEVNPDVFKDFAWGDTILLRTRTKPVTGQLTLTFPTLVRAQYQFGQEAEFTIDLGTDLQPGQRIPLEQSFDFLPGYPFTLRQVAIDNLAAGALGVTLTFAGEGYETILVNPVPFPDPPPQGGSSGPCTDFPGCFYTSTSLPPSADNLYRLAVGGLEHTIQGSWSLSFDLEETTP